MWHEPPVTESRELGEIVALLFAVLLVLFVGVLGYSLIEGWSVFDSLYMTVITLATVGFHEVQPMSNSGRLFTIILILIGVGIAMLVLTRLSAKVIERELSWVFKRRKMIKELDKLKDHIIFCGFGRPCQIACAELSNVEHDILVIELDPERVIQAEEQGFMVLHADATEDMTLLHAGIKKAKQLVTLLPKDADNLYVVLAAKEMNPDMYIVTRAEYDQGAKRLRQAGAQKVISPHREGGLKIANGLLRPHVADFLDLAVSTDRGELSIEEFIIPEGSPMVGMKIEKAFARSHSSILIAAMIAPDGHTTFNPSREDVLCEGTTLIGLGVKEEFADLEEFLMEER